MIDAWSVEKYPNVFCRRFSSKQSKTCLHMRLFFSQSSVQFESSKYLSRPISVVCDFFRIEQQWVVVEWKEKLVWGEKWGAQKQVRSYKRCCDSFQLIQLSINFCQKLFKLSKILYFLLSRARPRLFCVDSYISSCNRKKFLCVNDSVRFNVETKPTHYLRFLVSANWK